VSVDGAREDDCRDGDTIGYFLKQRGGGAESGCFDACAGVAVGFNCHDKVHVDVDALEEEEGFGV